MLQQPAFVNDAGELQFVSGLGARVGATVLANIPETAGAIAGSLTSSPVVGGAMGAAGGRAFKRGVSHIVFDEPATLGSVAIESASEGAANLIGGGIGKGIIAAANRTRIVDFAPADIRAAEQARQLVKDKLGIDLDIAQASGDRKLLAIRDYAATYPGKTAEVIQAEDEIAEGQLDKWCIFSQEHRPRCEVYQLRVPGTRRLYSPRENFF